MKNSPRILLAYAALALVQLAAPLSMVARHEATRVHGRAYRFRTAPVDPADFFRGRYVRLEFEARRTGLPDTEGFEHGERLYAQLGEDEQEFARITALSRTRPATGDWLRVRMNYRWSGTNVEVRLPFDRYYMNENLAPQAETLYRDHSRQGRRDAHATVRVRGGSFALEELYVGGQPIGEALRAK
jgi:uncharacterized membrane-anchored protein